jgi:hypothetical protein
MSGGFVFMTRIPDPVFVRGLSRSGGTLMCTLLDAHADIAMSYELYPNLLDTSPDADLEELATQIAKARTNKALHQVAPTKHFAIYVARCERGGLSYGDFARLLRQVVHEGHTLADMHGRMRLTELCGLEKMSRLGKRHWGMKCNNAYDDYLAIWPQAYFIDMLRDGRDVLASQLNTGSFGHTPAQVADSWRKTHRNFQALIDRGDVKARFVRYEHLTSDPEPELRAICAFLNLEFDSAMLRHHELDLTVFKTNHISRDRVASMIDTTKIGRWQADLTPDQLSEFMKVAGDDLKRHDYC